MTTTDTRGFHLMTCIAAFRYSSLFLTVLCIPFLNLHRSSWVWLTWNRRSVGVFKDGAGGRSVIGTIGYEHL